MPKRTNDFQKLVLYLEKHKLPNDRITESKELIDKLTGEKREVDIYIETQISDHPIKISIECTNTTRPVDVGWVEKMKAKHDKLDTDKLILVSKNGFTSQAENLAKQYGIQSYTFSQVSDSEEFARSFRSLSIKTFTYTIEHVDFIVEHDGGLLTIRSVPETAIHNKDSCMIGLAKDLAYQIMKSERISELFLRKGALNHQYFEAVWKNKDQHPTFLLNLSSEKLELIKEVKIKGRIRFIISDINTSIGQLNNVKIVWGKFTIESQNLYVIGTEDVDKVNFSMFKE
jgi:hypothetical protein